MIGLLPINDNSMKSVELSSPETIDNPYHIMSLTRLVRLSSMRIT